MRATVSSVPRTCSCTTSVRLHSVRLYRQENMHDSSRQTGACSKRSGESPGPITPAGKAMRISGSSRVSATSWSRRCHPGRRCSWSRRETTSCAPRGRVRPRIPQLDGLSPIISIDSNEAIAELEEQRSTGAEFLVIPTTSLWWLDHYGEFRNYLERGGAVARTDACVIYRLRSGAVTTPVGT